MKVKSRLKLQAALLCCCMAGGCREQILSELSEADANRAYVALSNAGISAERIAQAGTWSVAVQSKEAARALMLLGEQRISGGNPGGTRPRSAGLLLSKEERRQQLARQIEEKLEQSLLCIPGIADARVHFNPGFTSGLGLAEERVNAAASVLLLRSAETDLPVQEVRELVGGAAAIDAGAVRVIVAGPDLTRKPPRAEVAPQAAVSLRSSAMPEKHTLYIAAAAVIAAAGFGLSLMSKRHKLFLENLRSASNA